jgi:hypothetical protein
MNIAVLTNIKDCRIIENGLSDQIQLPFSAFAREFLIHADEGRFYLRVSGSKLVDFPEIFAHHNAPFVDDGA